MESLYDALTALHFVGWAIVLGGYVASVRTPGLYRGVFHGALTVLVAGVGMLALAEGADLHPGLDPVKMGVKLGLTVAICALAWVAARQGRAKDNGTGPVTGWVKHGVGALTLVTIAVACFWH